MSTVPIDTAQTLSVKVQEIVLADVAGKSGTDLACGIKLPLGAMITGGRLITTEAWNSTTSDVLDVGDADSQNRYLNDGNIRAAGAVVALVPTGYVCPAPKELTVRWTSGGGTPTTGKVKLVVEYVVARRATHVHE